jgi:hypothetical protein
MAEGSEFDVDPELGISFINETDVSMGEIRDALEQVPEYAVLRRWAATNQGNTKRRTIFDRDKYVNPNSIFQKFQIAMQAVETDEVVSNVVETTEQLAFKRIAMECEDEDEQNIWNQIVDDIDLPQRLRECWRELFTVSQAYPAVLYGRKNYKVKGKGRKKEVKNLLVPVGISLLDPMKVIPVGNFMFNQERLVYLADALEAQEFDTLAGFNTSDLIVNQLIESKYEPWNGPNYKAGRNELRYLMELTGQSNIENRMYLLRPEAVWRITSTRPQYQRFASVRMESVFELLDLKHQLREMDRSSILGTTNAIILVKKGDKDHPARPQELEQLSAQVQMSSRIPIIVGDHRLSIEIITPKTDKTLAPERYNGIDSRITARLYQILATGNYAAGTATDDSMKLLKVIASSMEARRDQIRDSFMKNVFKPTWMNNDALMSEPKMAFYPRRIALDFDPNIAAFLQQLRDRGDISRETILAELDILEDEESIKRQREKERYDEIFSPVNVPFSSPNPVNPADPNGVRQKDMRTPDANGQAGGNQNGGGLNPDSNRPNTP